MTNKWINELNTKLRSRLDQLDGIIGDTIDILDEKLSGQAVELRADIEKILEMGESLDSSFNTQLEKIDLRLEAFQTEIELWRENIESLKDASKEVINSIKEKQNKFASAANKAALSTAVSTLFGSLSRHTGRSLGYSEKTQDMIEVIIGSVSGALTEMSRTKINKNWSAFSYFLLAHSTFSVIRVGLQYAGYDQKEGLRYAVISKAIIDSLAGNTEGFFESIGNLAGSYIGSEMSNLIYKSTSSIACK